MQSLYQVKPQEDPLVRERREIARRRARNAERTKRILAAKTRTMGIDTKALAQQVTERQARERVEIERGQYYDRLTNRHADQLTELSRQKVLAARKEAQELQSYRQQQVKEKRMREMIKAAGMKTNTDTVPKLLDFAGEDPGYMDRRRAQQRQLKDWLAQQIDLLRKKEANELQDKVAYEEMQSKINDIKLQMEQEAVANRKTEAKEFIQANNLMSQHKSAEKRRLQQRNQELDDMELQHTLNSAFMKEDVGRRVMGGARACTDALPYHFKGFSTERKQFILDTQQTQIRDLQIQREQERQREEAYNQEQERIRKQVVLLQRDKARQAKASRLQLEKERKVQAQTAKLTQRHLDHVVYTNPVSDEFFNQFGTSCR